MTLLAAFGASKKEKQETHSVIYPLHSVVLVSYSSTADSQLQRVRVFFTEKRSPLPQNSSMTGIKMKQNSKVTAWKTTAISYEALALRS